MVVSGLTVRAGKTAAADLVIEPPGFIGGRVSEEEGGEPYAGLIIGAFAAGEQVDRARTDEQGRYRFAQLPPG